MSIRVVVADDVALFREGLAQLVARAEGLELAGTASDLPSVLDLVERVRPDVVVTDIRMPPSHTDEGIRVAAQLRAEQPDVGVVVLSQHSDPAYALALLDGGVARRGYLLKERVARVAEFTDAVRRVAAGESVIDPVVVGELVRAQRGRQSGVDSLSPRELDVLGEMAQDKSNAAIAIALTLTERAVEKHANSIFGKLGLSAERDINRRVTAVLLYLDRSR